MWSATDPNTQVVEVDGNRATLRVPLSTIEFDEGHPVSTRHCQVDDYDSFAGWALIVVPADEVEGLCAEVA